MGSRSLSKRATIDKEHAMFTARNVKDSKFGEAILRNNMSENRQLSAEISRLESEFRRKHMHFEQQRKRFIFSKLERPEPTLIVERPPSPDMMKKALYAGDADPYKTHTFEPGFMRPTRAKAKTPTFIPVIDAFTIKTRKKVNLWEDIGTALPRFYSTIMPSARLTEDEEQALQRGWLFHQKPGKAAAFPEPSERQASMALIPLKAKRTRSRKVKQRYNRALPEATPLVTVTPAALPSTYVEDDWQTADRPREVTFITELPNDVHQTSVNTENQCGPEPSYLCDKRVSFSEQVKVKQNSVLRGVDSQEDALNKRSPRRQSSDAQRINPSQRRRSSVNMRRRSSVDLPDTQIVPKQDAQQSDEIGINTHHVRSYVYEEAPSDNNKLVEDEDHDKPTAMVAPSNSPGKDNHSQYPEAQREMKTTEKYDSTSSPKKPLAKLNLKTEMVQDNSTGAGHDDSLNEKEEVKLVSGSPILLDDGTGSHDMGTTPHKENEKIKSNEPNGGFLQLLVDSTEEY